MDGQRFDEIAKVLASGRSRRQMLQASAAGLVAALGWRLRGAEAGIGACLGFGSVCVTGDDTCCSGTCAENACTCVSAGDICFSDTDCCDFLHCVDGAFQGGNAAACVVCIGQACQESADCCDEHTCFNGSCILITPCLDIGEICKLDSDCCDPSASCVQAEESEFGTCEINCGSDGDGCGSDEDCCQDFVCNGDAVCEPVATCAAEGDTCEVVSGDAPFLCCDPFICCSNVCAECCDDSDCRFNQNQHCDAGTCVDDVSEGQATVTIHKATCPQGTADLFGECHDNVLAGIDFAIDGFEVGSQTITTGADGRASGTILEAAETGGITLTEDADTLAGYVGAYVYCAEQNSGTVLVNQSAPDGRVSFIATQGDDIVCDWYNLTESTGGTTSTPTPTPPATTLPNTGVTGGDGAGSLLLGVAALGGAAALLAAKKLRGDADPTG